MMNGTIIQAPDRGWLLLAVKRSRSQCATCAFSNTGVMRSHENLYPQYQWSQSSGEGGSLEDFVRA